MVIETVGAAGFNVVKTLTVHNSKTSSAVEAYWTGFAGRCTCPVTAGGIGIIYLSNTLVVNIVDVWGKLAASVGFSIRQDQQNIQD